MLMRPSYLVRDQCSSHLRPVHLRHLAAQLGSSDQDFEHCEDVARIAASHDGDLSRAYKDMTSHALSA